MKKRKQCTRCRKRPAVFIYRGEVKRAKDHDLCGQCYRSSMDSRRRKPRVKREESNVDGS